MARAPTVSVREGESLIALRPVRSRRYRTIRDGHRDGAACRRYPQRLWRRRFRRMERESRSPFTSVRARHPMCRGRWSATPSSTSTEVGRRSRRTAPSGTRPQLRRTGRPIRTDIGPASADGASRGSIPRRGLCAVATMVVGAGERPVGMVPGRIRSGDRIGRRRSSAGTAARGGESRRSAGHRLWMGAARLGRCYTRGGAAVRRVLNRYNGPSQSMRPTRGVRGRAIRTWTCLAQ